MSTLIIGDTSRLGQYLEKYLKREGRSFIGASRTYGKSNVFLDLERKETFYNIPSGIRSAIVLAGTTDYRECENNREKSRRTNVSGTIELLSYLTKRQIYTVFVSTNTVLGARDRSEQGEYGPLIEYSKQKVEVEEFVRSMRSPYLGIMRLTKMVDRFTSPFNNWLGQLKEGKQIRVFDDLWMSPIRFWDACDALCRMLDREYPGILHCSGARDISYYEFACKLGEHCKADRTEAIVKTSSTKEGVNLLFNSRVTMLLLEETKEVLKVKPVDCNDVIVELLKAF